MLTWIAIILAGWTLSATFFGVVIGRTAQLRDMYF